MKIFQRLRQSEIFADGQFLQILILSFAFMLIFTAFWTTSIIEHSVLISVKAEYEQNGESFTGDGYISLAIVYTVLAILAWLAPSTVAVIGAKKSLFISAFFYVFFVAQFLCPTVWLLYLTSATLGAGAAVLWTAQGNYLSLNSTPQTISRNSGVFWAINQCSLLFGNLFVFWQFSGTHIDADTRRLVFSVLTTVCVLGALFLLLLKDVRPTSTREETSKNEINAAIPLTIFTTAWNALKEATNLSITPHMLLLSLTSLYTGLELSFCFGVYGTATGNTVAFGEDPKKLVGLVGILIGLGEVVAGTLFGLLGTWTTRKGKTPIVSLGLVTHILCFGLIYLNLANESSLTSTARVSQLDPPLVSIALFSAFLLGFGDACFQTQLISMFASDYALKSSAAFAIFKFMQSVGSALYFFASSSIGLYVQLMVLTFFCLVGSISFCFVEFRVNRSKVQENKPKSGVIDSVNVRVEGDMVMEEKLE